MRAQGTAALFRTGGRASPRRAPGPRGGAGSSPLLRAPETLSGRREGGQHFPGTLAEADAVTVPLAVSWNRGGQGSARSPGLPGAKAQAAARHTAGPPQEGVVRRTEGVPGRRPPLEACRSRRSTCSGTPGPPPKPRTLRNSPRMPCSFPCGLGFKPQVCKLAWSRMRGSEPGFSAYWLRDLRPL